MALINIALSAQLIHTAVSPQKRLIWTLIDRLHLANTLVKRQINVAASDRLQFRERLSYRTISPNDTVSFDFVATLTSHDIQVVLVRSRESILPISLQPSTIDLYTGDSGRAFRIHVVEDVTGNNIDLTGATATFLMRRVGQLNNVFQGALTNVVTVAPPAFQIAQPIVASPNPQSVLVTNTAGIGIGTELRVSSASQVPLLDMVNVTAADSTHITAIFSLNHAYGDYFARVGDPDPIYHQAYGFCTYKVPTSGFPSIGAYIAQLRISYGDGSVEHSAPLSMTVRQGV